MLDLLYILATWRLTNLIYAQEAGPWHLVERFRLLICRNGMVAEMVKCPLCVSMWAAGGLLAVYRLHWHSLARWLAWSGAVCLIYILLDIGHKLMKGIDN